MESEVSREMLEWAREVEIRVQDCDYEVGNLKRIAAAFAEVQRDMYLSLNGGHIDDCDRDMPACFDGYSDEDQEVDLRKSEERQLVNLLRHVFTNYDKLLDRLHCYAAPCSCPDNDCVDGDCIMNFDDEQTRAYCIIKRRVHEALITELPQYAEMVESIIRQESSWYCD